MDDAALVCHVQRLGDLPGDEQGLGHRDRTAADAIGERVALDQLQDQARRRALIRANRRVLDP